MGHYQLLLPAFCTIWVGTAGILHTSHKSSTLTHIELYRFNTGLFQAVKCCHTSTNSFFFFNIHLFLVNELTGIAVLGLQVDTLLIFSFSKSPTPQPLITSCSSFSYYSTLSSLPAHAKALHLHFSCFVSLSCWFVFLACLVHRLSLLSLLFF